MKLLQNSSGTVITDSLSDRFPQKAYQLDCLIQQGKESRMRIIIPFIFTKTDRKSYDATRNEM